MPDQPEAFYDKLASSYHTVYQDWERSIQRQARSIDTVFKRHAPLTITSVLDAACGIGTQALGLAAAGYTVTGSDISAKALRRCKREARARKLQIDLHQADFRSLDSTVPSSYDAVIAMDNSLPHLLTEEDMQKACSNFFAKLNPGGLLLLSTRDYDNELQHREQMHFRRSEDTPEGQGVYFDLWDWQPDDTYILRMFHVRQVKDRWRTAVFETTYRAWRRNEIVSALDTAGFAGVRVLEPGESGYYQPVFTATRPFERRSRRSKK